VPRVASTYIAQRLAGEPRMGKPTNITSSSIGGNIDRPESGDITADYTTSNTTSTTTAAANNGSNVSSINLPIVTTNKNIGVISDAKYSAPFDNSDSYASNTTNSNAAR
jgi:hypothetical protein